MPRVHGPRANLRQESGRFFAGHHRTTGAGPSGLIIASAPGVCAWATPFCPFLAKTGGSRWDLVAIFLSSSSSIQTVYMSLSTSVYFSSTTAGRNDWESFSPGSTEFSLQPHQSATASLPSTECTAVSHPTKQPHLLGTIALRCARVKSNSSNALTCSSPLTCST